MKQSQWATQITLADDYTQDCEYEIAGGVWPLFKHWHVMITRVKSRSNHVPVITEDTVEHACDTLGKWLRGRIRRRKTPMVLFVRTSAIHKYLANHGAVEAAKKGA